MSYNEQSHVGIGDLYTASMHNTLLDNVHTFWANAAAGGMPYWSAANLVALLAKPATRGILRHDGTTPSWLEYGASQAYRFLTVNSAGNGVAFNYGPLKFGSKTDVTGHTYNNSAWRDMPNSSLSVTLDMQSTIITVGFVVEYGTDTPNGYGFFSAKMRIDGTDMDGFELYRNYNYQRADSLPLIGIKSGVAAGSRTIVIRESCGAGSYQVTRLGYVVIIVPEAA